MIRIISRCLGTKNALIRNDLVIKQTIQPMFSFTVVIAIL